MAASDRKAHWLTLAKRGFRYADELDYVVRQWVIPDHPSRRPAAAYPMWSDGLLNELQFAIGRCLQAEYDLAQPIPDHLAALVRDIDT